MAGKMALELGEEVDARLARSLGALKHRGPDGEGRWTSPGTPVALGHRRLAIIDLTSDAAQPMATEDGAHVLTFNGEVYDYREVRAELERRGHTFRTSSDTEVLLVACRTWGPLETARRVRGMFAFGYADLRSGRLWLVRDRFGEKPLYWTHTGGSVAFASELPALTALTGTR